MLILEDLAFKMGNEALTMVEYKASKRKASEMLPEDKWSYRKILFTGTGYLYSTCGPLELEIYGPGKFSDRWHGLIVDTRSKNYHYYDLNASNENDAKREMSDIANKLNHTELYESIV